MVGVTMATPDAMFSSIFPAAALDHTTPTPIATPDLGFTGPGQSFGSITSPIIQKQHQPLSAAQLQVKRNIAWSTATRFLTLAALSAGDADSNASIAGPHRIKTREVEEAIDFLLSGEGPHGLHVEDWDLVEWYLLEVRTHFLDHVAPAMQQAWSRVCLNLKCLWMVSLTQLGNTTRQRSAVITRNSTKAGNAPGRLSCAHYRPHPAFNFY
jgi:anaphase-promoting complex subunit 2